MNILNVTPQKFNRALIVATAALPSLAMPAEPVTLMELFKMASQKLEINIDASGAKGKLQARVDSGALSANSPEQVISHMRTAIRDFELTMIHEPSLNLYRIMKVRDARDSSIPVIDQLDELPRDDRYVTYLHRLTHLDPQSTARNLRSFAPANSRVIPSDILGGVMVSDRAGNIHKYVEMTKMLDTPKVAQEDKAALKRRAERRMEECELEAGMSAGVTPAGPSTWVLATLGLMLLMIGFGARGYLIRRIEGGL